MFDKTTFADMDDDGRDRMIEEWLKTHDPTYCPSGVVSENVEITEKCDNQFEPFDSTPGDLWSKSYWLNRPAYDDDDYRAPGDIFAPD